MKKILLFLSIFFLFFFLLPLARETRAEVSCTFTKTDGSLPSLYTLPVPIPTPGVYVDMRVSNFSGTTGSYYALMKFIGSDSSLSPGKQDWTAGIYCIDEGKPSYHCSAGAYYIKSGCFTVAAGVVDETGFHLCKYQDKVVSVLNFNICWKSPFEFFTLSKDNLIVEKGFGDYICSVDYWNDDWYWDNYSIIPPAYVDFSPIPEGKITLNEWINANGSPITRYFNFLNAGISSQSIRWTLGGIDQDETTTTKIVINSISHRTEGLSCPGAGPTPIISTPTPTPTPPSPVAPVLRCIANNGKGSITWNWSDAYPKPEPNNYKIQVNPNSYSLNPADGSFTAANTENSEKPGNTFTDYANNDGSPLTNDTYYGHIRATNGNLWWSNVVSCTLSTTCEPPSACYSLSTTMCSVDDPQLDCASGYVCCEPGFIECISTSVSCNKLEAYAGQAVSCSATSCSAPNICPWTSYLSGNSILSNSHADSGGPGISLGETYPTANEYLTQNSGKSRAEDITAQNSGKVNKIEAFIGWNSSANYETVYIKIAKWVGGNSIVDFSPADAAEAAVTLNPSGASSCTCQGGIPCLCKWIPFDIGNAGVVNEPLLNSGSTYIILMKRGSSQGMTNPVAWANDGWVRDPGIYPNRYRVYLRPPVDKSYGTYLPTSGGSTTWTVSSTAVVGEDWIVTARVYDAGLHCWGWGNNWPIKIVTAPTATPTPTASPTPTQGPWRKLKNSSFQSKNELDNRIPAVPVAYDFDDTALPPYFIVGGNAGVVTSQSLAIGSSATISFNKWFRQAYQPTISLTKSTFLSYIKSRKQYTTISSAGGKNKLSQIKGDIISNGIFYFTPSGGTLTIKNSNDVPNYNFVLIVNGIVNIDIVGDFNPAFSIAILADNIVFYSTVTRAKGIFIADTAIDSGSGSNGLKIVGNISSPRYTTGRSNPPNSQPSLFVVADPKQYLDLLPFLSIDKYDWRQLQ